MFKLGKSFKKIIIISSTLLISLASYFVLFQTLKSDDKTQEIIDGLEKEIVENKGNYDERQIVLEKTNEYEAKLLAERLNAKLRISFDGSFATLTLPENLTIGDVVSDKQYEDMVSKFSLDYHANISEVEDEYFTYPSLVTPNDEYYKNQTYLDYINLKDIWGYSKGTNYTIAVIDTGIDTDHPEFEGRVSEYSYNATEDKIVKDYVLEDGNYDWSLIEDEQGHGTAVTGVIAASMNNEGITGIAPNVEILTIKVECDEKGEFTRTSDLVFGLYYAIERDVDVVNMSFGGPSNIYAEPAQLAYDSDIILVAAAGNNGTAQLTYPAADPNVIGVGALADNSFELADYSNYGDNVDVVAPGTTFTTKINGTYGIMNGTSFATPIVAASVILQLDYDKAHRAEYPSYENTKELLEASSIDLGTPGKDFYYGYGALDISAFILEERKTVTFDYLTEEIEETKQIFIKDHPLQNMPEPERLYSVFDGWYYDIHCYEEVVLYEDIWVDDITIYCNWVNEDDGVPYSYITLEDGTIEITSYLG